MTISTYYERLTCGCCNCDTNAGEVIVLKIPRIDASILGYAPIDEHYIFVCPTCYATAVKKYKTASVVNCGSYNWHRVCPRCYAEADRQLKEENE